MLDKFYINGEWVSPVNELRLVDIINPATGTPSGQVAFGDEADAERAIKAAKAAFDSFSQTTVDERVALLERVTAIYERRLPEIAAAITKEMGAPLEFLSLTRHAPVGVAHLMTAIEVAREALAPQKIDTALVVKEPVGVCALIAPWNWPMNQVMCKVAPALVAGCTVVLKPSQFAPYSSAIVAEVMHEAGVPAGVFNMVQGEGGRLGNFLSSHPDVDMVSLTGSTAAGAQVSKAAADTIKRVSLELGGKSANIILPSADFEAAITHGVAFMMYNSGQTCTAPSRMLVPRDRLEEVFEIARRVAAEVVVGDPLDAATTMGPLANIKQFNNVRKYIDIGLKNNELVYQGELNLPEHLANGYFVPPTIFFAKSNDEVIAREEVFGPVLTILAYDSVEEAVAIANDSVYGLSGYVSGATIEEAAQVARRMRTGTVHLNCAEINRLAPFGGYKQSGNGREWGAAGIHEFVELKSMLGAAG